MFSKKKLTLKVSGSKLENWSILEIKFPEKEVLKVLKEYFDKEVIRFSLRKNSEDEAKELKTHVVYAGDYYFWNTIEDKLRSFILQGMKKYKIQSVMMTRIRMWRSRLITKEVMEKDCKGEDSRKDSVNDDLESFFENVRLGRKPDELVSTYYLPKLEEEEMELVETKDTNYLQTFDFPNPDVPDAEMKLSESDSKFVEGWGQRETFTIENFSENSSESAPESSFQERTTQFEDRYPFEMFI